MKHKYIGEDGQHKNGDVVDIDVKENFSMKTHKLLSLYVTVHGSKDTYRYGSWEEFNGDWEPVSEGQQKLV